MLEQIISLDRQLLSLLNGSDSLFLDGLMWTASQTSTWILVILGLCYVVFRKYSFLQALLIVLSAVLVIVMADQFSSSFCKPFFHCFRPTHDPELGFIVDTVNGYRAGLYGFFSSHAANTFGTAFFFTLLLKNKKISFCLFGWAVLASYSRIYLGVHFPGDILVGILWGAFTGCFMYLICEHACRFVSKKYSSSSAETTSGADLNSHVNVFSIFFALTVVYIFVRAFLFSFNL